MIPVVIDSLVQSLINKDYYVIILKTEVSGRYLPVPSNLYDFQVLAAKLHGQKHPRPLSYDFFLQCVQHSNLSIRRVYIHSAINGRYKAQVLGVRMDWGIKQNLAVDCRAADALLTAVYFQVPIFISDELGAFAVASRDQITDLVKGVGSLVAP